MALFPRVQRKAQEELDRVVGMTRLPEFDDLNRLPYLRAILMEVLRWIPVAPFGVPHATDVEDSYEGYHIPKGSMIIPVSDSDFRYVFSLLISLLFSTLECLVCPSLVPHHK